MTTREQAIRDEAEKLATKGEQDVNVYLAGRYSRREELCRYAEELSSLGWTVEARWLHGSHTLDERGLSVQGEQSERAMFACEDWEDVTSADVCISFTESPRASNSRGGRHVEFGAAMALGKRCIVIGPRENVFHHLPELEHFDTWEEFILCERYEDSGDIGSQP